jgi:hypothetical protein
LTSAFIFPVTDDTFDNSIQTAKPTERLDFFLFFTLLNINVRRDRVPFFCTSLASEYKSPLPYSDICRRPFDLSDASDESYVERMLSRVELAKRFPVFAKFVASSLPIHGSHRGGRHWGKENTLATYRRAVHEARTEILEIDIWKTKDEHLVLNHDGVVNGTSVNHSSLQRLQQIDGQLVTLDQLLSSFFFVILELCR